MSGTLITALSSLFLGIAGIVGVIFTAWQARRGSKPDEFRAITSELRIDLNQTRDELKLAVGYVRELITVLRTHDIDPPPVPAAMRYPWGE